MVNSIWDSLPYLVSFTPTSRVCTDGRAYGHVITKISRMDGLPKFLSMGLRWRARR